MAVRVVVGEDEPLVREGIVRVLEGAEFEVVGVASDAADLIRKTNAHKPDVVVTVVVLSQFLADRAEGVGYLLKERVGDLKLFADSVRRVAAGGTALDPQVVQRMVGRRRANSPLDELTPR